MTEKIGEELARITTGIEAAEAARNPDAEPVGMVRARCSAREPAQVYNLRIPVDHIVRLRRLADQQGVTPSALMRTWVLRQLAETEATSAQDERSRFVAALLHRLPHVAQEANTDSRISPRMA